MQQAQARGARPVHRGVRRRESRGARGGALAADFHGDARRGHARAAARGPSHRRARPGEGADAGVGRGGSHARARVRRAARADPRGAPSERTRPR